MTRRLIILSVACVFIGMFYFGLDPFKPTSSTNSSQVQNQKEPLYLPEDFDDSFTIDPKQLEGVVDFTVLDNDQRRWDRGFWACLEVILNLSPQEISRRALTPQFDQIRDDQTRPSLRGKILRIQGQYQPDTKPIIQLPSNPTGRQFMRLGVVGKPDFDPFRLNVPEAWLVYFLDDLPAQLGDTVQVEGIFFKILKITSQKNNKTYYLPALIARSPQVLEKAATPSPSPTFSSIKILKYIGFGSLIAGASLLTFLAWRHHRRKRFRDQIFKRIQEKKQQDRN